MQPASMAEEEDDDYLSMSFGEAPGAKETSLQRTVRLKKEAAERGRVPSKAELREREELARETALATAIDDSNKGAKMMAKMGFKGGALGKSENARTQPIELQIKDDRGGIGMDSEKKRKVREAAEATEVGTKRQKVDLEDFRERSRVEREELRSEGMWWGAIKVLEGLEDGEGRAERVDQGDDEDHDDAPALPKGNKLKDVNVLYRPLLKQRLEKDRGRKMRYDLNNSLSTRNDGSDSGDGTTFDKRIEQLEDEDPELDEYEALSFAERLERVVTELREKHHYCVWCKYAYPDAEMDGCPGLTVDEHG